MMCQNKTAKGILSAYLQLATTNFPTFIVAAKLRGDTFWSEEGGCRARNNGHREWCRSRIDCWCLMLLGQRWVYTVDYIRDDERALFYALPYCEYDPLNDLNVTVDILWDVAVVSGRYHRGSGNICGFTSRNSTLAPKMKIFMSRWTPCSSFTTF